MSEALGGVRRNVPLFVAYRLLFHARFYYPVLGVLFLDLGATAEEYALLNVVWAAVLGLVEAPLGALADVFGRKRLLVASACLMVAEMVVLLGAPLVDAGWRFWWLLLNRVLSAVAEACGSGADEALAYDSLAEEGRQEAWAGVLELWMRWKSGAFIAAMLAGAALYDSSWWAGLLPAGVRAPGTALWPVWATLLAALGCLGVTLGMREPPVGGRKEERHRWWVGAAVTLRDGARHVVLDRRLLVLLLAAVCADAFLRVYLTFGSNYYRVLHLPAVLNGVWGAGFAVAGWVAAVFLRRLAVRGSAVGNFLMVGVLLLGGLWFVAQAVPGWGALVIVPLGMAMAGVQFLTAYYLNLWTPAEVRATVLSFRGVVLQGGYGAAGLAFAGVMAAARAGAPGATEDEVLLRSLWFLPAGFAGCAVGVGLVALAFMGRRGR